MILSTTRIARGPSIFSTFARILPVIFSHEMPSTCSTSEITP
jgi:hypothetical protein